MPRRMPFRRPGRRRGGQRRLPPRLRQAHRMLDRGKHQQAARLFLELAKRAEDLHIARAPLLYLQAGRAFVLSNELDIGREHIKRAIDLLAEADEHARLRGLGGRVVNELERLGFDALAEEIEEHLSEFNIPDDQAMPVLSLPPKCEQCGATLHPDEVEKMGDSGYACAYCGSRVMVGAD